MKLIPSTVFSFLLSSLVSAQDLYDEATVRDLKLTFAQSNWWTLLDQNRPTETYLAADLEVDGVNYFQVGVRFKGNSSASVWPSPKMPFKIKMDEFVAGQELLGYDTINLGNSFMDPTFCREVVTYHVMRQYMPAPKANFVRLWLNGSYWGIYNNTQQVSGEFLSEWFDNNDGNRYKCDPSGGGPGGSSTLTWQGSNASNYFNLYELKSAPNGTEWMDLIDLCNKLNNGALANLIDDVDDVLRIDRALWYLAAENLFVNRDSYIESGHNYYVFNDLVETRFSTIPWDSNEAFGNFGMGKTVNQLQTMSPLENYGRSKYPLLTRLLNASAGKRGRVSYFANYREMLERSWDWSVIGALVTQYQTLIEADVVADSIKLYSTQYFYDNVTQDVLISGGGPGGRTSCGLQPFVNNRQAYLLGRTELSGVRPTVSNVAVSPVTPSAQDTVSITARLQASGSSVDGALLMWRVGKAGPFNEEQMYDDGLHGDGAANDGVWGGNIAPQTGGSKVSWYLLAWTPADRGTHYPWQAEEAPDFYVIAPTIVPNGIVINEFLAENDNGLLDEAGELEDWIEIMNSTSSSADLSGWSLSDDAADPQQWAFPPGTILGSGKTLLVWADNDLTQGSFHANFKLGKSGEEILLLDGDGVTFRDYLSFGQQGPDISTGRLLDGVDAWVTFSVPTPNASNEQSCGYRSYDQLDPTAHGLLQEGAGSPAHGGAVNLKVSGTAPGDSLFLYVSTGPDYLENLSSAGTILISPNGIFSKVALVADANGEATLNFPLNKPSLIGRSFYSQAHLPSSSLGAKASNALEVTICP